MTASVSSSTISVSSIEIGTAGGAAGGAITIDSTSSVTEWGTFDAATIVDNGSLAVAASQTLYVEGSLSGVGNVTVNAGSSLYLFGATTKAANTITFSGAGGTLYLLGEYGLPNGMTLNGWGTGDNIEVLNVTDAAYSAGKLVLYKNGVQVGYFKVASSYANDSFDVVPQSNGYSNITLGPSWLNAVSGNFATAADWSNGAVPGVSDSAAISTAGIYTVSVTASTSLLSIEEADAGATLSIAVGDALTLDGASNFSGAVVGNGELNLTGGVTTFNKGAAVSVATLALSATGANLTIAEALSYAGAFQAGAGSSVTVSGGNLTLTGPAAFTNAAVNGGAYTLFARGATSLTDGLAIGGTLAFETVGSLTQSGGTVTDGDAAGDIAEIRIASTGTWDITDASGIALGTSTASTIVNDGLFEKTAGTGESTIAPAFDNAHNLIVSAGTLDLTGAVTGTGTDTIQGSATELEFELHSGENPDRRFLRDGRDIEPHRCARLRRIPYWRLHRRRQCRSHGRLDVAQLQGECRRHARRPDPAERRQRRRPRVRRQIHAEQLQHQQRERDRDRTHLKGPMEPTRTPLFDSAVGR